MNPIDPKGIVPRRDVSPMAPPFVDDDVNADLVQQGMDVAEDETRKLVSETYESEALQSDEKEEFLDDIEYPEDEVSHGTYADPGVATDESLNKKT